MLYLSGFELYSRWVPLTERVESVGETAWRPYARTGAMRHGDEDHALDIVTNMKYI